MALQVTHLSVALTIGGNNISLVSEVIPGLSQGTADPKQLGEGDAAKKAKEAIKRRMEEGMTFAMEPGVMISVSIGEIVDWIKEKFKPVDGVAMPELIGAMSSKADTPAKPNALNGLIINLWGLSLSTKGNFTFNMRLDITQEFYDGIGVPEAVTNIITIDSLGIGIVYTPKSQEEEKEKPED